VQTIDIQINNFGKLNSVETEVACRDCSWIACTCWFLWMVLRIIQRNLFLLLLQRLSINKSTRSLNQNHLPLRSAKSDL